MAKGSVAGRHLRTRSVLICAAACLLLAAPLKATDSTAPSASPELPHHRHHDLGDMPLTDRVEPVVAAQSFDALVEVGGSLNWSESVTQASLGAGVAEAGDRAGSAILVFDFTLDGVDDLVVGAALEDVGTRTDAGVFTLVPGDVREFQTDPSTIDPQPVETYSQSGPMAGSLEAGDRFGASLAGGDFNGDGFPELVVGAPGEGISSRDDAGNITLIPLSQFEPGLDASSSLDYSQSSPGVSGTAEADDRFGEVLAVGDFNGDGVHDLAVGVPGEDIGNRIDAGGIHVMFGSAGYFATSQFVSASTAGVAGAAEADDRFGQALAAGDFDMDGFTDLAVGIPGEDVGSLIDAGAVHILFGGPQGLRTDNDILLTESTPGVAGGAEAGDEFGAALAAGDFRGIDDFAMDLVVGSPGEDIGNVVDAGAVHVFYGDANGFTVAGHQYLYQDSPGVNGSSEAGDRFGASLAAGSAVSNGVLDPQDDLVIGVPGEDVGSIVDAGLVAILRGSGSGITTTNNVAIHAAVSGVAGAAEAGDELGASVAVGDVSGSFQPAVVTGTPGESIGSAAGAGGVLAFDPRAHTPPVATDQPDDVTGKQIHIIYAIPSDASEGRNMDLGMRVDQNVVQDWFTTEFGGRELRWDTINGILDISTVTLPVPASDIGPSPNDVFNLEAELQLLGFDDPNKLYLVYYEGEGSACGVALADSIAVVWMASCGGSYPEFRTFPTSATFLAAHELTHGLGAVPSCAPNHANSGHVNDDNKDILYVAFDSIGMQIPPDFDNLALDPGNNDYYQHNNPSCPDIDDSEYLN